jgi:hypothetical protein
MIMKFYRWPKGGVFVDEYFAIYENGILFFEPSRREEWIFHCSEWNSYYNNYKQYLYQVSCLEVLVMCGSVPTKEDFKEAKANKRR